MNLSDLSFNQLAMGVRAYDADASEFLVHLDDASPSAGQDGRIPACLMSLLVGPDDAPASIVGRVFILTLPVARAAEF